MQVISRCRRRVYLLSLAAALRGAAGAQQQPAVLPAAPEFSSLSGTVTARDGTPLQGATVGLEGGPATEPLTVNTGPLGDYAFRLVRPGRYTLTIQISGFATFSQPITAEPGSTLREPPVAMSMATAVSEVRVNVTERELAAEELKEEETQRVFGIIPNFLVSYDFHPAPLSARQKFQLSWRTVIDPVNIGITAAVAGVQQADDALEGYGQGAQGYFKRFGAGYADLVAGTFFSSAVLPVVFHQEPRYLVMSSGTVTHRTLYAISATVICRGDNGLWQPNYSNIGGSLAAGALSNLYYPASDRSGLSVTLQNTLIGLAFGAADNIFEEFLVRKLTPHPPPVVSASSPTPP